MIAAAVTGFFTGLSLILAIGSQNAFLLRQGLTGRHVGALVLFFAVSDAVLIGAGVAGFARVSAAAPWAASALALGGAAFLIVYGALRLRAAALGGHALTAAEEAPGLGRTLALGAAFTWGNPHVYLDTLALIGAVSAGIAGAGARTAFAVGAIAASFVFFAALGYGARALAPVMRSPRAWQMLDAGVGAVMWSIAAALIGAAV